MAVVDINGARAQRNAVAELGFTFGERARLVKGDRVNAGEPLNGRAPLDEHSALGEPGGDAWRLLKAVSPLQDLLTGLTVELRKRGETTALASWKHAVSPTPDIMCKGLAIQLSDGTETLGRLSAFVTYARVLEFWSEMSQRETGLSFVPR